MATTGVNWSDELEELHEESSRTHFIDVWTRTAMIERLGDLGIKPRLADIGCSTGYLLEDLRARFPEAALIGIDGVLAGLRIAKDNLPGAGFAKGDANFLPLASESLDAVLSANLLEHIADDRSALAELHRVLRPDGIAVLVVPRGARLHDYYDRYLHHERRYRYRELATKARSAGFQVLEDVHLGTIVFPAFWLVKKHNRLRYAHLDGDALAARVAADIARTKDSALGHLLCRVEASMLAHHLALPFGIRGLTVLRRR
jgi:SAM-dependent methyltransferase